MLARRHSGLGGAAACFLGWLAACGSTAATAEPTASSSTAIQGGTTDTIDLFAVGVARLSQGALSVCSGVLLAPNLVATARHCVTQAGALTFDCATSTFGALVPPAEVFVTTDGRLSANSSFATVATIVAPSKPGQDKICGNDIALLILTRNISLSQYVTPTIDALMTDAAYSTSVTAIGYGIDTPADEAGTSAGLRRSKGNVGIFCVPNATRVADCFSNPLWARAITASEFVSGDASTCEGDSGSGAFDQASFSAGKWVSFGVLSRGAVSQDGKTCIQPIYERFDAWGQFIADAAKQAASAGGYGVPVWANAPLPPWDAGRPPPAADSGPGGVLPGPAGDAAACAPGGGSCPPDASTSALASTTVSPSSGCALAAINLSGPLTQRSGVAVLFAIAGIALARRRDPSARAARG